jgi:aminoglycoside phosphotransferase (APT) family kinase protein
VPVPVIEAADPAGDLAGVPCALLRRVDGGSLSGAAPEFGAVGPILRQVHEVILDGSGSIAGSSEGLHGEDHTWADTVRHRIAGLGPIAGAGLVAAGLLDRAVAAVEDRRELFATPHGGRLLHGDFHPRHVYALGGRITAIIDWGDATCGDPVYDLGRLLHSAVLEEDLRHGFSVVNRVLDSYGDAAWLPADLTGTLLVYAAVFTLWSMQGEFSGGAPWPPWWPAQATALSVIVDELDRR